MEASQPTSSAELLEERGMQWVLFPVILFAFHRALLMAMAWFGLHLVPTTFFPFGTPPFSEPVFNPALSGLCRWDCGFYYNIARHGYPTLNETQAFPLYALITRGVAAVTGMNLLYALILVANLAGLGALLVIYRLFRRFVDRDAARWGITLFTAYPFAFFHGAGFPESLTVLCAAGAILLALEKRHIAAGLVLALGSATRHVALIAAASMLAIAIQQRGWRPRALLWNWNVLGLVLPLLGIGAYAAYCAYRFHDPLAFFHARTVGAPGSYWRERAWWGVTQAFRGGRLKSESILASYVFWSLIPWAGTLALLSRPAWRQLAPYPVLLMLLHWSGGIMGLGRFSAACWPAYLPLGVWLARRPQLALPILLVLGMAQGFYFYLWSHWFGIW